MSMQYWAVRIYGINEKNLIHCWADNDDEPKGLFGILEKYYDSERAIYVKIKGGKEIPLCFEPTEDDNYFGYEASYPWEQKQAKESDIKAEDVETAIVKFLKPYGYTAEEIHNAMEYINTYNCG